MLALALTLFVLDVILDEDTLSWTGVAVFAAYLTWRIAAPWKWSILVFIASAILTGVAYCWLFKLAIGRPVRRLFQRNAPDETLSSIQGAPGTLHIVSGKVMFRWNGDELWPVANPPPDAADGQKAVVKRFTGGQVEL